MYNTLRFLQQEGIEHYPVQEEQQNMKYKEPANRTANSHWSGLASFSHRLWYQNGHLPCKLFTKQSHFFTPVTSVSTWMQFFTPKKQNITIHQQNPLSRLRRKSSQRYVLKWCYCHIHNIWWTWIVLMISHSSTQKL